MNVAYTGQAIGRNKTCPCGSGKKFKKCCQVQKQYARWSPNVQAIAETNGQENGGNGGLDLSAVPVEDCPQPAVNEAMAAKAPPGKPCMVLYWDEESQHAGWLVVDSKAIKNVDMAIAVVGMVNAGLEHNRRMQQLAMVQMQQQMQMQAQQAAAAQAAAIQRGARRN